jgi:hypothetical protein
MANHIVGSGQLLAKGANGGNGSRVVMVAISSLRECRVAVPVVEVSHYFITPCLERLRSTRLAALAVLVIMLILVVPVVQEAAVIIRWLSC